MNDASAPRLEKDGDVLLIHIPMQIKRRGGRKEIIVPEGLEDAGSPASPVQESLVVALARAHAWRDLIESGRYSNVTALASALDVDRAYVRRMVRLTLLAPDIVEAILQGREPSGMSLATLVRPMSVVWAEQRKHLELRRRE